MIRAFSDDDLDPAAALLEKRHRRHLRAEPLLPAAVDYRAEVEALWRAEGASGVSADGGFLIGFTSRSEQFWGPNVWIENAGHAASDPELVRDLYAEAAAGWVERGLKAHYVVVPASDHALLDAWFRLGFGAQQAQGMREIPDVEWPESVRPATTSDLDQMVALEPVLREHQRVSPVFSGVPTQDADEVRGFILEELGSDRSANVVADLDGRLVGDFLVCPIELSPMHAGLARPPGAALLDFAVTTPDVRGRGFGVALTDACFAWAREHGYETMVTDWRVTNLLSSRFWPKRGFRTSFLRLHRLIA